MSPANESLFSELDAEFNWLQSVIQTRLEDPQLNAIELLQYAPRIQGNTPFGKLILRLKLNKEERAIFAIALSLYFAPEIPDLLVNSMEPLAFSNTQVGGRRGLYHNGLIPTMQTALFVLGGRNHAWYMAAQSFFDKHASLLLCDLIQLDKPDNGEPITASILFVPEYIRCEIKGEPNAFFRLYPCRFWEGPSKQSDFVIAESQREKKNQARLLIANHCHLEAADRRGLNILLSGTSETHKMEMIADLFSPLEKRIVLFELNKNQLISINDFAAILHFTRSQNAILFIECNEIFEGNSKFPFRGSITFLTSVGKIIDQLGMIVFFSAKSHIASSYHVDMQIHASINS
jgi:hypothetical protein